MNDLLSKINALEKSTSWDDESAYTFIHQGVQKLLTRDVQLLFQLLYRIDVKETLVKNAFQQSKISQDLAHRLTTLILERIKQKAEIRRRYSAS